MKRDAEKGSALLIVFVFAAIAAIMLYMEMPVTVFEAKRQKEEITIDHGKEYAHAVKLFVRKIGRYPSSLDELENTNRMRFLRHRFKDPLTGNEDWRLLHAGPGGAIIDSKVKPAGGTTFQGNTNSAGFGAAATNGTSGSTNPGTFGSTNSGQQASNTTSVGTSGPDFPMAGSIAAEASAGTAAVLTVPQRRPAIAANGAASSDTAAAAAGVSPNEKPGVPAMPAVPPVPAEQSEASATQSASATTPPELSNTTPNSGAATGTAQAAGGVNAGGINAQSGDASNGQGQNTASGAQNLLNKISGSTGQTNSGTGNPLAAGGIAGVAVPDKVAGAAIKAVNDQHKYALWEFYYDPTQDTLKIPNGAAGQQPASNTGAPGSSGSGGNSTFSSGTQTSDSNNAANGSAAAGSTAGSTSSNTNQTQPQ